MAETPTISQLKIDETAYNIRDANALRLNENDKLIIANENEEHLELSKNSIILKDINQNINFQVTQNALDVTGNISGNNLYGKNLYIGKGADNVTIYSNTTNRTGQILKVFDGDSNGAGIAIGGGGLTILGSGEAAQNLYSALGLPPGNESLHLGADTDVYIYSNCQTVANRKQLLFNAAGNLVFPDGGYPKFGFGQQLRGYTTSIYLGNDDDSPASGDIQWRFLNSNGAIQYRTHNGSAWGSWQYPPISASTITSGTLGLDRGGTGTDKIEDVSTISSIITAATGFTISSARVLKWGPIINLYVSFKRSSVWTGNAVVQIGTVKDAYKPTLGIASTGTSYATGNINNNGKVYAKPIGTTDLAANTERSLSFIYIKK